ncbi:hypothetical protein GN316_12600 [Xylophilus sp. Kf1]|nr:hypothetical protein [Xylophilus sp. Kf1]
MTPIWQLAVLGLAAALGVGLGAWGRGWWATRRPGRPVPSAAETGAGALQRVPLDAQDRDADAAHRMPPPPLEVSRTVQTVQTVPTVPTSRPALAPPCADAAVVSARPSRVALAPCGPAAPPRLAAVDAAAEMSDAEIDALPPELPVAPARRRGAPVSPSFRV